MTTGMLSPSTSQLSDCDAVSRGMTTSSLIVGPTGTQEKEESNLQIKAIENARAAYSRLPNRATTFQECIRQSESIIDVLNAVVEQHYSHKSKKSTRLLAKFQEYTLWLQNISDVVDVVVQTQAGIGCPLWAPIKFVLQISKDHAQAAESIIELIKTISENITRFDIYKALHDEPELQAALLDIFTDVVEFAALASRYFGRHTVVRLTRLIARPFKEEFQEIFSRIKRHSKNVDSTALAIEIRRQDAFRKVSESQKKQYLKVQCEAWLKPTNNRAIQQSYSQTKLEGTCEWIWSNSSFNYWKDATLPLAPDRLLCIYGTHGCGKTILASSVVDHLHQEHTRTLFFSFSGTEFGRQTFDGLVRSFLWQLLQHTSDEKSLHILRNLMLKGAPLVDELWSCLKHIATLITEPVYCIIDGIDESTGSTQILLDHILELLTNQANFRSIFLGRPHALQAVVSAISHMIEITPNLVKQDIEAYIDTQIERFGILKLPTIRETIFSSLREKSDGMFLWVKLMIDDLQKSGTAAEVRDRLRDIPRGLEMAYHLHLSRLVDRLDTYEMALAKNILTFVVASFCPLDIAELSIAHALQCGHTAHLEDHLLVSPEQKVLDVCGSLVNISNGLVRPVHFSLNEFLRRPENEWIGNENSKTNVFRVDLEDSHQSLGRMCISYLQMVNFDGSLFDTDTLLALKSKYPFLKYASKYLPSHLSRSGPLSAKLQDKLMQFFESVNVTSWMEYLYMMSLEEENNEMLGELQNFVYWLHAGGLEPPRFLDGIKKGLSQELSRRIDIFGEADPRTEQCNLLLEALPSLLLEFPSDLIPEISTESIEDTQPSVELEERSRNKMRRHRRLKFFDPNRIIQSLEKSSALSLHAQVDMLLRLQIHLRRVKCLTDPLKTIFNFILNKAPTIPVYALTAIAAFYSRLGKSNEAIEVYNVAFKKVETREVPLKYGILHFISWELNKQKKYAEAEPVARHTLQGREIILGMDHKETLCALDLLANVVTGLRQYNEAKELRERLVEGREKAFGQEHHSTLGSICNLGVVFEKMKRFGEAEKMFRKAIERGEKSLGEDHHDFLLYVDNLAIVLERQGQYKESEERYRWVLKKREKVLGLDHKYTVKSREGLAFVLANAEMSDSLRSWDSCSSVIIVDEDSEDSDSDW